MKKYLVLKNDFQPSLTDKIFEGEQFNEYVKIDNKYFFLKEYVKEVKEEKKVKTNKTKVINSINVYNNRGDEYIKEVIKIKNMLKKYSVKEDIDYIRYKYDRLIELYYLSNMSHIHYEIAYILKDAIKLILDSNIELKNIYEIKKIKEWIDLGIN